MSEDLIYRYDSGDQIVIDYQGSVEFAPAKERVIYSDLNQDAPELDSLVTNVAAIVQGIGNLFRTLPGERLFRPTYGSNFLPILFAPINQTTAIRLREMTISAVEKYEPRVSLDRRLTRITPLPNDDMYEIVLVGQTIGIGPELFEYRGFFEKLPS